MDETNRPLIFKEQMQGNPPREQRSQSKLFHIEFLSREHRKYKSSNQKII